MNGAQSIFPRTEQQPRLLSVKEAATYCGLSFWTLRDFIHSGLLPTVRLPAPRARDGRTIHRILIDVRDLDLLIERSKESETA